LNSEVNVIKAHKKKYLVAKKEKEGGREGGRA
jgi:hypothetical protein